jgi:ketosteroid isomerase-like protein
MKLLHEIPDIFWSLFRSKNRDVYIEALLQINEEYQYSNYFLSKDICIQILSDYFNRKKVSINEDEMEGDLDALEPPATRILNWLLHTQWLRKVDDYSSMTVNIVIPDYAAIFVDAFLQLSSDEDDATQVFIQNIYAILFSFKNDARANVSLLNTALINTKKLNKTLQDMLHNMDKFFSSLLEQKFYGELLREHLEGYVEEIVKKKYHILKTSDNFYLYKTDIKRWLGDMREDIEWIIQACRRNANTMNETDIIELLDMIERGFDDIEHRISNMDKEHSKYVRATVTRLNYLLSEEDNMKGLVIQLLNHLSRTEEVDAKIMQIGKRMNLSQLTLVSEKSFYKRRKPRQDFTEHLVPDLEIEELSMDEILKLNKIKNRYSKKEIEEFISERMVDGKMTVNADTVHTEEEFEKLVLAYDYSIRRDSLYKLLEHEVEEINNGKYKYPNLVFVRKRK